MAIYNEDELFWWKMGQSSRVRSIQSAPKKAGGRTAGEVAIRAGNTVAWYDYTDLTTITKDGSDLVSKWADKLGGGKDLANSNGASQPTYTSDGILFNDKYLEAAFTYAQPKTIYLVLKWTSTTNTEYALDGRSVNTMAMYLGANAGGSNYIMYARGNTQLSFGSTYTINTFALFRIVFNGASSSAQINNGTAGVGNAGTSTSGGVTLGASALHTVLPTITVKELILRSVADGATDYANIGQYLINKYSISV